MVTSATITATTSTTATATAAATTGITELIRKEEEEVEKLSQECKQLLSSLPRQRGWRTSHIYLFQNFWCQAEEIQSTLSFQRNFAAQDSDIVLATIPKSGTTWLKALAFAIANRKQHPPSSKHHPLLTSNPHVLVPFFEYKVYADNNVPDFSNVPNPRIFGTHIPFPSLSESIKNTTNCRIVYLCRNPFDTFISTWHYLNKVKSESLDSFSLEEAFDNYCNGVLGFGPFWNHMLGYWKESLERPKKVLFLKYEDMKEDIVFNVKKLGEFIGVPFSVEEENEGVVEEIVKICSFEILKDLEVNKSGKAIKNFENMNLFRKGVVGDWENYLTPLMVEKLSQVVEEKLGDSGLQFKVFS